MTTVALLPAAAEPLRDGDLTYVLTATGADSRVPLSSLQRYFLGRSVSSLVGFYGATLAVQPLGSAQAVYTVTLTAFAPTVGAAVVTTAATNTSPFGFATAGQANDLVSRVNQLRDDILALQTRIGQIQADQNASKTLIDAIRSALVSLGLIKGSA
jgi:hypothetical protein